VTHPLNTDSCALNPSHTCMSVVHSKFYWYSLPSSNEAKKHCAV
jgi:hypothetical protein